MRKLFATFMVVALAGCAATGPVSSPEFPTLVAKALPPEAGQIVLDAPGYWFPNTIGFSDLKNNVFAPMNFISGVVVVGTSAVVFAQWDDDSHRYNVMKEIKFPDLAEARIETMGIATRLVLKRKDYSYDTFQLQQEGGYSDDKPKVQAAADYLNAQIGSKN